MPHSSSETDIPVCPAPVRLNCYAPDSFHSLPCGGAQKHLSVRIEAKYRALTLIHHLKRHRKTMPLPRRRDTTGTDPLKCRFYRGIERRIPRRRPQADIRNPPGTAHIKYNRDSEPDTRKVRRFDPGAIESSIELVAVALQFRALGRSKATGRIMHSGRQIVLQILLNLRGIDCGWLICLN